MQDGSLLGFMGNQKPPIDSEREIYLQMRPQNSAPWMVIRDFNKILFHSEKVGGRQ